MVESDIQIPAHERVYRALRGDIMHGVLNPSQALTIRGLAAKYDCSMTPAREAVRRLNAEGAISMSTTGRISTPELKNERIEELAAIRSLLEPELAARAMPRARLNLIERLDRIDSLNQEAKVKGDATGYIRTNLEFHRTLYLRAQAPAMLALVETVWLQLGPTMQALYDRIKENATTRNHKLIIAALKAGDEPGLRVAIRADVSTGLRLLKS